MEAKYTDKPNGIYFHDPRLTLVHRFPRRKKSEPVLDFALGLLPGLAQLLIFYRRTGLTLTQSWNTVNALNTKVELKDSITPGLKIEAVGNWLPTASKSNLSGNLNLHYQHPNFHGRAMIDVAKPSANIDAVLSHEGAMAGGSVVYDVQKAAITNYGAALGFMTPQYTIALVAANQMNVVSASYYHKVNSKVEAGAKAIWDSKIGDHVGLELASKYRLDPTSWAKVSPP